ncbi:MAG TPA: ATP-binding cassette domain-containing protein [Candidatus Eremiobacteraceae bacterium]|nr:ATP-binding cassette domain-containing protein [Candidatus Eremiobacteraceae bacterium]
MSAVADQVRCASSYSQSRRWNADHDVACGTGFRWVHAVSRAKAQGARDGRPLLSGGEQQMLAIGRGIMAQPSVLLLDEPSMGLSPKLTTEVFRDIRRIADTGRTIVVVEQNAYAALGIADYGYVLEGGRVALSGSADKLASDDYVRQAYLGA